MDFSLFTNITFFWFSTAMHSLFISWIEMTVIFLTASYAAAQRIMLLGDCIVHFSWRKIIRSSVLSTCNSIGTTIWRNILFISSDLSPEYTCMGAAHAWVFVVKLVGLRGVALFLQVYPWWCCKLTSWRHPMLQPRRNSCGEVKTLSSNTSPSTHSFTRCRDTSV